MKYHNTHNNYFVDENEQIAKCIKIAELNEIARFNVSNRAYTLIKNIKANQGIIDLFMRQYDLSNQEGVTLMCLAEALLRIPDKTTTNEFIKDKIIPSNWYKHVGKSESFVVNTSTLALMLTRAILSSGYNQDSRSGLAKIIQKSGEPLIREMLTKAMRMLGDHFIMAKDIETAITKSKKNTDLIYSFDMLGESAYTAEDANRYYNQYKLAIIGLGQNKSNSNNIPSLSVKLSALHPRYEFTKKDQMISELLPKIHTLCTMAMSSDINLCIDAEEADRLAISLEIIKRLCNSPELSGWNGLGFAVQAYQKRALSIIDWSVDLAKNTSRKLMLRLVKGAYWDFEIKYAQEMGHVNYPVFTSKAATDVSYLACAKKMLEYAQYIYPCFATHNAHTISYILEYTKNANSDLEFQRLYGMGECLHKNTNYPCRIYAPIGNHTELLPYLIRRLLENCTNGSFNNQLHVLQISDIIKDPILSVKSSTMRNKKIPLPLNIFGNSRLNSKGLELENPLIAEKFLDSMKEFDKLWTATPILDGVSSKKNGTIEIHNPASIQAVVGYVSFSTAEDALLALSLAHEGFSQWQETTTETRATHLEKIANIYEDNMLKLVSILVKETGKVISDAVSEVREAVDFLRYYASQAKKALSTWEDLPGVIGESNKIGFIGRGVFLCISPWNFPLAIFTGQIAAALVTGNTVLAKASEKASIIGFEAVKLMHEAGIPKSVLHLLLGDGAIIGNALLSDQRIAGVAFTGSIDTAHIINRNLAARDCGIAPLIAETGGVNAMIVDASALTEQVTKNVIASAFHSAGQRCSALRVLFLQEEIADKQITMIIGAMQELEIGDPSKLSTDVGPIIDNNALNALKKYIQNMDMDPRFTLLERTKISSSLNGHFFAPCLYTINSISQLKKEAFGPILHVVRYKKLDLDHIINEINATGYGLTFSIQSRINSTIKHITSKIKSGNIYVNRNQIGAVVESQPFGGCGLSGTGPKAGGPRYLHRFCTEQVVTVDTTAIGGNIDLLNNK